MYSRDEAAKLKTEFWTAYGKYMSPVPSSEGEHINWINYRTGEKFIQFKTETDNRNVSVSVVFNHPDKDIRDLHKEQFEKFRTLFSNDVPGEWIEYSNDLQYGMTVTLEGYSIFNKTHWPHIISFLKQHMIALDAFWNNVKYAFEELR